MKKAKPYAFYKKIKNFWKRRFKINQKKVCNSEFVLESNKVDQSFYKTDQIKNAVDLKKSAFQKIKEICLKLHNKDNWIIHKVC